MLGGTWRRHLEMLVIVAEAEWVGPMGNNVETPGLFLSLSLNLQASFYPWPCLSITKDTRQQKFRELLYPWGVG